MTLFLYGNDVLIEVYLEGFKRPVNLTTPKAVMLTHVSVATTPYRRLVGTESTSIITEFSQQKELLSQWEKFGRKNLETNAFTFIS